VARRQEVSTEERPLEALAAGSMFTTAGIVASGILGFAVAVLVTRGLGPVGAGVFFQSVALLTILASLGELGAPAGLVRTIPRFQALGRMGDVRGAVGVALWPVAVVSTMMAAGLFITAPSVARLLGLEPAQGSVALRILAPFLPVAALSNTILAITRGFRTMVPYVVLENIAKPALRPVLIIVAIASGLGASAALLAWALPAALVLLAAVLVVATFLRRDEGERTGERGRPSGGALASEFWRFAAPRGLASIFQVAILWLDVILIGSLRSTQEAGLYAAVGRLITVGIFAIEGMRLALAPEISGALARQDHDRAQLLYRAGTWWLIALSWPVYLTLAIFSPIVLRVFGPEFEPGATALVIISLAMLVGVGTGNVSVVLLMGGKSVWNLANTAAAFLVNVLLNLLLIPILGMTGAAIAWAASLLVNNLLPLAQVGRSLRLNPFGRGFVIAAGSSLACFAVVGIAIRTTLGATIPAFVLGVTVPTALHAGLLFRFRDSLHLAALGEVLATRTGWLRRKRLRVQQ
jgi:O-antigen/teichoic acid export membrane protein